MKDKTIPADADQPATKGDLHAGLSSLEQRMDKKFATKQDLKSMEQRMDKKFATKKDLHTGLHQMKDDIIDAISDKITEESDHLEGIIESIDHDKIKPLHDKIDMNDEKVDRNTKRIEQLEQHTGVTNPFPT